MRLGKWTPYVFIFLTYLTVEGLCYLSLRLLATKFNISYDPNPSVLSEKQKTALKNFLKLKQGEHVAHDSALGWVLRRGANSAGMRDDREYEKFPPRGIIRIAAFGDSFTYGSDVALGATWAKQLGLIGSKY